MPNYIATYFNGVNEVIDTYNFEAPELIGAANEVANNLTMRGLEMPELDVKEVHIELQE